MGWRVEMEFFCENPAAGHADDRIWKGYVKQLRRHGDTVEADISGKGSAMHVIIGRYEYGRYLCIPDWGIGSTLAALDDCFWNREQLERQMGRTDAITLSEALKAISKELEDMG